MKTKNYCLAALILFLCFLPRADAGEDKLPFPVPKNPNNLPEFATVETTQGPFEIRFFREEAPITVANFEYLGKKGFYKGLSFHRYLPGFVIQGGDPLGNGKGGPGHSLPPEVSTIEHVRGTIGMARFPSETNPERKSNGSQFYICLSRARHLDGLYSVFAEVIRGMDNVERLRIGDKILAVRFPQRSK